MAAVAEAHARRRRVFIVDDDRVTRDALQRVLEGHGWEVALAASGPGLLTLMERDGRPDVLVLDIAMSWMSGFELCRAMKANVSYRDVPVVFISGRSSPADIATGMSCGASDYFVKPLDVSRLVERLQELST